MKVFKVTTNDGNRPTEIEATHYYEDGSFVVFSTGLEGYSNSSRRVASFNKMSITSIVFVEEFDDPVAYEDEYEYERDVRIGNDADKVKALIRQSELSEVSRRLNEDARIALDKATR